MYTAANHCFVVCAYKENPYIRETIKSLKAQTVKTDVLLSTSTPSDYLRSICSEFNIKMLINDKPHLAGDDWNYGYDHAETELVTMAHQDDYYDPRFVETTLNKLNAAIDSGRKPLIAFTEYFELRNCKRVDSNLLLRIKRLMNAPFRVDQFVSSRFIKQRVLAFGDSICCPSVTFVKTNVGKSPFDTKYRNSCDYKTWVDLAGMHGSFEYIPENLVGHRIYAESATSRNLGDNIRRGEDLEILKALWPRPIASFINRIYSISEKSNNL